MGPVICFAFFLISYSIEKYLNTFRYKHLKNIHLLHLTDILKDLSALGQLSSETRNVSVRYRIDLLLPANAATEVYL